MLTKEFRYGIDTYWNTGLLSRGLRPPSLGTYWSPRVSKWHVTWDLDWVWHGMGTCWNTGLLIRGLEASYCEQGTCDMWPWLGVTWMGMLSDIAEYCGGIIGFDKLTAIRGWLTWQQNLDYLQIHSDIYRIHYPAMCVIQLLYRPSSAFHLCYCNTCNYISCMCFGIFCIFLIYFFLVFNKLMGWKVYLHIFTPCSGEHARVVNF